MEQVDSELKRDKSSITLWDVPPSVSIQSLLKYRQLKLTKMQT